MSGPGQPPPGAYPWPPPYPGPGGSPPPWAPPPRPRRSRWLTVGVPSRALLLLGGCGTLAVLAVNAFTGAIGPATQATEEYATALVEQRWDDAREMLCDEVRPALTPG